MKKVLFSTFTVVVFVLLLNSCGGGGGGSDEQPSVDTQNKPIERLDPTKLSPEFD